MKLVDVLPDAEQRTAVLRAIELLVKREVDSVLTCDPSEVLEKRYVAKGAQKILAGMNEAFSNSLAQRKAARSIGDRDARSRR